MATNALYSVAMSTLLISHPAFLDHDTGEYHPERPDRLRALLGALEGPAFDGLKRVEAPMATHEQLVRVHPAELIETILSVRPPPGELVNVDPDTVISAGTAEAIQRAAGDVAGSRAVLAFGHDAGDDLGLRAA